jgi:hypothetical protein
MEHCSIERFASLGGGQMNWRCPALREAAEWIEREALADLGQAARERAGLSLQTERSSGALLLCSPEIDSVLFNRVLGLGLAPGTSREQLAAWVGRYRAAQRTRFFFHLYEDARPPELPSWLAALGLTRYRRSWHQLGRGRDKPLPRAASGFALRPAALADAAALGALFASGFDLVPAGGSAFAALIGRSGWEVLVAEEAGEVVAAGLSFTAGEVAYLAGGVTRGDCRGRGAQLALMVARCRAALERDCRWIVSETGAPAPRDPQHSHRNMERCALQVFAVRHNYGPDGLLWQHGRNG